MSCVDLYPHRLWYRVDHPEFNPKLAYRAIGYVNFGESAWSQLLFITELGLTYSVKVSRTMHIEKAYVTNPAGESYSRLFHEQSYEPFAKAKMANPDVSEAHSHG